MIQFVSETVGMPRNLEVETGPPGSGNLWVHSDIHIRKMQKLVSICFGLYIRPVEMVVAVAAFGVRGP